jgi:predicted ester cyclase
MWVAGAGLFEGRFVRDYLSIPASGKPVQIRWGEFCRLDRGRVVEVFCLLDLVDLMEQAGSNVLPASRGEARNYPPPRAGDGIMLDIQDDRVTRDSLRHIREFIFEGSGAFDQSTWLQAFPDSRQQDLDALFAEGPYSAAAAWAGVLATHRGAYLGLPPSGKRVEVNGLDFRKREGGELIESWSLVDQVHLFRQMGVNLFDRIG